TPAPPTPRPRRTAPPGPRQTPSRPSDRARPPRAPAGRPTGDAVPHSRLSATILFRSGGEAGVVLGRHDLYATHVARLVRGGVGHGGLHPGAGVPRHHVALRPPVGGGKFFPLLVVHEQPQQHLGF